jgi:hypothetical protein
MTPNNLMNFAPGPFAFDHTKNLSQHLINLWKDIAQLWKAVATLTAFVVMEGILIIYLLLR